MDAERGSFEDLVTSVRAFRDDRDWAQFHNPKDLAVSITIEAAELLEQFQWKDADEVRAHLRNPETRNAVSDEMADVLILLVSCADTLGVDLLDAAFRKLEKNAAKYPVEKARGRADKYDRL
jgi:NTP pyrophosphatase (non-canonical NTP hydrolase)